jgi:hypothetical protein
MSLIPLLLYMHTAKWIIAASHYIMIRYNINLHKIIISYTQAFSPWIVATTFLECLLALNSQ